MTYVETIKRAILREKPDDLKKNRPACDTRKEPILGDIFSRSLENNSVI